jgi:putative zinc finger protein
MRCDDVRELAPELALGIVDGEERADALRHLTGCADCRRAVEELSEVADDLLMVAPLQEPSAGFESRVVAAMGLAEGSPRPKRPRWRSPRWLALRIGPVVATAAVTVTAMVGVYHNDHVTAQRYRDTLAEANGRSFQAQKLTDESGDRAGVAFGYEGRPSWLLLTVDPSHRDSVHPAPLAPARFGWELGRRAPGQALRRGVGTADRTPLRGYAAGDLPSGAQRERLIVRAQRGRRRARVHRSPRVQRRPDAAAAEAPAQLAPPDGEHAVGRHTPADPHPTVLAAREEVLDAPGQRHPSHERDTAKVEPEPDVDPVAAGAEAASAREVVARLREAQLGERVLGHAAQGELHGRECPAA